MTFSNVTSVLALTIAMGTGGAYAADTIGSSDIIDESIQSRDIKNAEVKNEDLRNDALTSSKINNGTIIGSDIANNAIISSKINDGSVIGGAGGDVADGTIDTNDLADGSASGTDIANESLSGLDIGDNTITTDDVQPLHGDNDILDNTITTFDIASDAIDSDEVLDFGLSNQDVGVLSADINNDGTVASSSGGVTAIKLGGVGQYEVDFGRDVTQCSAVATIGPAGGGSSSGQVNVADRAGNGNAVFVDTNDTAGDAADRPFRLIVVC